MERFGQNDGLSTVDARSLMESAIEIFRSQNATRAVPRGVTLHLARRAPNGTVRRVPGETPKQRRKRIVAANLRHFRQLRGLSQEELAKRVGVERPTVVKWEGARWEPGPESIEKLANALGVQEHEFYRDQVAA